MRYILDVDPGQVELLEARLTLSGIRFDRTDNLCAMPWSNDEAIFTGADLEWLPSAMNRFLKERRDSNRVRECLEWLDTPRGPNRGIRIRAAAGISLTRVIPSAG